MSNRNDEEKKWEKLDTGFTTTLRSVKTHSPKRGFCIVNIADIHGDFLWVASHAQFRSDRKKKLRLRYHGTNAQRLTFPVTEKKITVGLLGEAENNSRLIENDFSLFIHSVQENLKDLQLLFHEFVRHAKFSFHPRIFSHST